MCSTPFGITEVGAGALLALGHDDPVCSTPFGITEVGARGRPPVSIALRVLNAFRHHRGGRFSRNKSESRAYIRAQRLSASQRWAPSTGEIPDVGQRVLNAFRHHRGGRTKKNSHPFRADHMCSTPFGITEVGAGGPAAVCALADVLNAFRHHRGGRMANEWSAPVRIMCSTPFGITEVGATPGRGRTHPGGSAQRLSASQRWAHDRRGTKTRGSEGAQRLSASQRWARPRGRLRRYGPGGGMSGVLNAFRHHRGGRAARGEVPPSRAEVLNAFRHHRGGRTTSSRQSGRTRMCSTPFGITEVGATFAGKSNCPTARAQRLSASQRWALGGNGRLLGQDVVLNAFRHHRGGRAGNQGTAFRPAVVLNAFRHHRGGRARTPCCGACRTRCSTPFGITEVGARRRRRQTRREGSVLNAFRHHRGGRGFTLVELLVVVLCSTPFGITEVGALRTRPTPRRDSVLNAFRHHRGGRSWSTARRRSITRAQRLSASQRWARKLAEIKRPIHPALNAFRHHRGGRLRPDVGRKDGTDVLNAFRHHRGGRLPSVLFAGGLASGAQRLSASQRWAPV